MVMCMMCWCTECFVSFIKQCSVTGAENLEVCSSMCYWSAWEDAIFLNAQVESESFIHFSLLLLVVPCLLLRFNICPDNSMASIFSFFIPLLVVLILYLEVTTSCIFLIRALRETLR